MTTDKTNLIEFVKNIQYGYHKNLFLYDKEKIKELDIYYTPYDIVIKIINYLKDVIEKNKEYFLDKKVLVVEPSAGTGVFVTGFYQELEEIISNVFFIVNDLDKNACAITKKVFDYLNIKNNIILNEDYLSHDFFSKIQEYTKNIDLVIVLSNPPYGSSKKEEGILYKSFILKSLEYFLDKKFIMFFIVPESFRDKIYHSDIFSFYYDFISIGGNVRSYNKDRNVFGVTIPVDVFVISNCFDIRKKVNFTKEDLHKINTKDLFIKGFFGYKTGNDREKVSLYKTEKHNLLYHYRVLDFRYIDSSLVQNNNYYNTIQMENNWAIVLYDNRVINNKKKIAFATTILSDLHTGTSTVDYCIPMYIKNNYTTIYNLNEKFMNIIQKNMSIHDFFYFMLGYLFSVKNIEDVINQEQNYFFYIDLEHDIDNNIKIGKKIVNEILHINENRLCEDDIFIIDKTIFPEKKVVFLDKTIKFDNKLIFIKDNTLYRKIVNDYKNKVKYFGNVNPFWNYILSRLNSNVDIVPLELYRNLLLYTML